MLVMIRWLMTIMPERMMTRWPSVVDKFSLDLDLRGRLVRRCGKFARVVECRSGPIHGERDR